MGTNVQELAARAKQLVLERNFAEAVRACRRLLLSRPDDDDARLLLGRALIATERFDEVRVEMMSLIRRRPESATAHRLLGESFLRAKQPKRGEEYLRRALELDPDDDEAAELLEDLAADPPPVSATVERWFDSAGVATIETPASFFDDGSEDRPATAPIQDAPPSIQIDPELAAVAESMALLKSEDTVTSVETPEPDGAEETDAVTNPDAESPPAAVAAMPTARRPKQTMMGIAGLGQLAPGSKPERGAFGAETTSELGLEDLEQVASASPPPTPKAPLTSELDAGDLEPVDSKACFEPLDAEPMEAEATSVAGASLAPLDEEATQLRAPARRDEPEHTRDLRARAAAAAAAVPAPTVPTARPRVVTLPPPPGPPPNVSAPAGATPLSPIAAPPIAAPPIAAPPDMAPSAVPMPHFGGAPVAGPPAPLTAASAQLPPLDFAPAPTLKPGAPVDFAPGASPRASIPERRPVSTTEASRAVAVSDGIRRVLERVRGLRDRLPNPKLFPLVVAAPILLLALIIGFAVVLSDRGDDEEIAAALLAATDDARATTVDRAIARDEDEGDTDDESVGRRAHLLALAAYETGRDSADLAAEMLRDLDDEARAQLDARLAKAYLRLRAGDIEAADTALAVRRSAEDPTGEVGHLHALIALARGDYSRAAVEARASVTLRPASPRHRALLALAQALDGHADSALVDLGAQPGAARDPSIRMVEARVRWITGDESGAKDDATSVVEELRSVANPRERAWAHWVRASVALANGDHAAAKREAAAAAEEGAPGDESFALHVAETLALATDTDAASTLLSALPETSPRPHARAQALALVYLEAGDLARAATALADAGDSPKTAYLRGRLAEAQGDSAAARRAYEAATALPSVEVRARVRLGAMALRSDEPAQALSVLSPGLERAPSDVSLVPIMARALLADAQGQRAAEIVRAALTARPGAYPLAVAEARVALARGNGEAAQAALETLTQSHATDPELWALLGAAAHAADHAPRAKQAYEKALELQPDHVDALLGLLNLAIEQSDTTAGHEALDRAASAGVTGRPLELGRARLMVLEGGGAQAVPSLRRLSRRTRDATLYAALGQAYLQAEQSRRARRAFSRALRYDADELDAHIGLASLGIHAGGAQLRRAASHIGSADRVVQSRNLGTRAQARIATLRAEVLYFGNGDMDAATEQARAAVALDPSVGEAHLLLASVLSERGQPVDAELRAAIGCPSPPPEAFVRLALDLGATTEGCELARRYLTAAPRGSWASDARGLVERCE